MRITAFALGLAAPALFAQEAKPQSLEDELLALMNTPVQGASKREQRLVDAPQAIEVVTAADIRAMGAQKVVDVLRAMTSVDVLEMDDQATWVALRGAMQNGVPRTLQVLVDGVPLYNAFYRTVDLGNLPVPLELIDRIEVVRGPASSIYGANAVVGVLAISTRRPGEGLDGQLSVAAANNRMRRGSAVVAWGHEGTGLEAGWRGMSHGATQDATRSGAAPTVLDADAAHQGQAFVRAQAATVAGRFWAEAGASSRMVGTRSTEKYAYQRFESTLALAGWSKGWHDTFSTEVRLSRTGHKFISAPVAMFVPVDPAFASENPWADYASTLMEFQASWNPGERFHLVGGFDRNDFKAQPSRFVGIQSEVREHASGAFLNLDLGLTRDLTLNLGARRESVTLGGSRTSPRAVLMWKPTADQQLRLGFYSSTRSPQIMESRINFTLGVTPTLVTHTIPNPDLKPEKLESFELGYRNVFGALSLDATVFSMAFTNLISTKGPVMRMVPPVMHMDYQYVNEGEATNRGAELALTWVAARWLTLGANATWLDFRLDSTGERPNYAPAQKVNLWARANRGRWSGYLGLQHIGGLNVETTAGSAVIHTPRAGYNQVHANLAYNAWDNTTLSAYLRNGARDRTEQSAGGPFSSPVLFGATRELGVKLECRF